MTTAGQHTLNVPFTPVQHGIGRIPNPRYVLFVIDHNGVGTVTLSDPAFYDGNCINARSLFAERLRVATARRPEARAECRSRG